MYSKSHEFEDKISFRQLMTRIFVLQVRNFVSILHIACEISRTLEQ